MVVCLQIGKQLVTFSIFVFYTDRCRRPSLGMTRSLISADLVIIIRFLPPWSIKQVDGPVATCPVNVPKYHGTPNEICN